MDTGCPIFGEMGAPLAKFAFLDGVAHFPHQVQVVMQIVHGIEPRSGDFAGALQVVQIRPGKVAAGMAGAVRVPWARVVAVARIADLYVAVAGGQRSEEGRGGNRGGGKCWSRGGPV